MPGNAIFEIWKKETKKSFGFVFVCESTCCWTAGFEMHNPLYCRPKKVKPQLHSHNSGHDSSRFEPDGKIGMRRDGKKKIKHQYGVSRCSYGVCTINLRILYV